MRDKMKKVCCLGICLLLIYCTGCKEKETLTLEEVTTSHTSQDTKDKKTKDDRVEIDGAKEIEEKKEELFVYVCGEVVNPGVYELKTGSRLYEAIRSAGGMTENADDNYLNQAESLRDGQQIYVPSKEEVAEGEAVPKETKSQAGTESGKVNLNTASKEELMTLTGIGEAKADSILRYREENGGFGTPEDLMQIEGIKDGVFNKIKDKITV